MMTQFAVTEKDALEAASVFMNAPSVLGVQLIGSVAREGVGNDLDLVLIVSSFRYASFVRAMADEMDAPSEDEFDDMYTGFKSRRRAAALKIVALSPALYGWLECASRHLSIDFFLMPEGWRKHVDEVQTHLPHSDPEFVRNIARDAVTLKRHTVDGLVRAIR